MNRLAWRTFLPAFLAIALFSGVVFVYLLPSLDRVVMDQKRLMIRELTESAWNILARFEAEESAGRMTRDEAQAAAIEQVRSLHYGAESKDYFWIIDERPYMVVHPYRPDLEGTDLSQFEDRQGQLLFVEMADIVRRQGAGYVRYTWQWKDEADRIVPKLSYVKGFAPWGWIIGTGVYTRDVDAEIASLKGNLQAAALVILVVVAVLLFVLSRTGFRAEKGRLLAAAALRDSEEKYRSLVESAGEAIFMDLAGEGLYANASLLRLLGYERAEFAQLDVTRLIRADAEETRSGRRYFQSVAAGIQAPIRYEAELVHRDGRPLRIMLTLSRIVVQGRSGFMAVATRLNQPRELDVASARDVDDIEAASRRTRDLAALMLSHGVDPVQVVRLLSAEADAIVRKVIEFVVAEIGPPPTAFDVLLMGSLGRREVTLLADQDHAIIYPDQDPADEPVVNRYFLEMGCRLTEALEAAGFPRCLGGIMASESACCQSLGAWRSAFDRWVGTLEPDDLLQAKIFFDFRGVMGEPNLVMALQEHLAASLAIQPRFFPFLAQSILRYEPPLNTFGHFVTREFAAARTGLDIKGVLAQVVDAVRLRALRHGIAEAGTLERLHELERSGHLRPDSAADTERAFRTLLGLRLGGQARRRGAHLEVDNILDPNALGEQERSELKRAFAHVKALQENLRHEFGAHQ